jgi:hypothetical protein
VLAMEVIDDDGELRGFHHLEKPIVAALSDAGGESEDTSIDVAVDVEVVDVIVVSVGEEDDEEVEGVMVVVVVVVDTVTVVGGGCIRIEGVLVDVAVDGCNNVCSGVACVVGCMRMVRARRSWYAGDDEVGDVVV